MNEDKRWRYKLWKLISVVLYALYTRGEIIKRTSFCILNKDNILILSSTFYFNDYEKNEFKIYRYFIIAANNKLNKNKVFDKIKQWTF